VAGWARRRGQGQLRRKAGGAAPGWTGCRGQDAMPRATWRRPWAGRTGEEALFWLCTLRPRGGAGLSPPPAAELDSPGDQPSRDQQLFVGAGEAQPLSALVSRA
jgi:hypothetical protein